MGFTRCVWESGISTDTGREVFVRMCSGLKWFRRGFTAGFCFNDDELSDYINHTMLMK
jgi:hypothetical protein